MRFVFAIAAAAASVAFALPAAAAVNEEAVNKLMKDEGCLKCHAMDKTKKGPSYKKTADKYKGKADAEAKLTDFLSKSPKVKLEDGTEEEHKALNKKYKPEEIKNLIQFILSR
jgi:cytochrome c